MMISNEGVSGDDFRFHHWLLYIRIQGSYKELGSESKVNYEANMSHKIRRIIVLARATVQMLGRGINIKLKVFLLRALNSLPIATYGSESFMLKGDGKEK